MGMALGGYDGCPPSELGLTKGRCSLWSMKVTCFSIEVNPPLAKGMIYESNNNESIILHNPFRDDLGCSCPQSLAMHLVLLPAHSGRPASSG